MRLTLEFHQEHSLPLDIRALTPRWASERNPNEISKKQLPAGNQFIPLGELCKVHQHNSDIDEMVLCGNTAHLHYAGYAMSQGRLLIDGDTGRWTGAAMSGGEIEIHGNAADCLAADMQGGFIRCLGNAADYCAAAAPGQKRGLCGGTVYVAGNAGDKAGAAMRRGLLVIAGDSGELTGADMLAGSIFVFGKLGKNPALNMRRGSIVAGSLEEYPPDGFMNCGTGDSLWLDIYLRHLEKIGITAPTRWRCERWQRYSGDHSIMAKGEIYTHVPIE